MKYKLLIIGQVSQQLVANFRTASEAFHAGSLLQASTEDKHLNYFVQFKEKGATRTQPVDSFTRRLPFLNQATTEALKEYYNK